MNHLTKAFAAMTETVQDEAARRFEDARTAVPGSTWRQDAIEERVCEERAARLFSAGIDTYSAKSLLEDVDGDLMEATRRYIANDELCTGQRNPQLACEAHIALMDMWLGLVAAKPIESPRDYAAKVKALLHYLRANDEIELLSTYIDNLVQELHDYRPADLQAEAKAA